MALAPAPNFSEFKLVALQVDFNKSGTFEPICGLKSFNWSIRNETSQTKVPKTCDPADGLVTHTSVDTSSLTISARAIYTGEASVKLLAWSESKAPLPCRIHNASAAVGQVEYIIADMILGDYSNEVSSEGSTLMTSDINLSDSGGWTMTHKASA